MRLRKTVQHGIRLDQETDRKLLALCGIEQRNINNLIEMLIIKEFNRRLEVAAEQQPDRENVSAQQG